MGLGLVGCDSIAGDTGQEISRLNPTGEVAVPCQCHKETRYTGGPDFKQVNGCSHIKLMRRSRFEKGCHALVIVVVIKKLWPNGQRLSMKILTSKSHNLQPSRLPNHV